MSRTLMPMLELRNAELAEYNDVQVGSSGSLNLLARSGEVSLARPERRRGIHANGYKWGPGRMDGIPRLRETNPARIVAGQSLTLAGYELLDGRDSFVSWFECVLDAVDALKAHIGPGKIVRCSDRALLKIRHPHKART